MTVIWLGTIRAAMTTRKTMRASRETQQRQGVRAETPSTIFATDVADVMMTELRT